ncbi:MAG: glycosyltransferase [Acidobacteriota bacterium]|nr:glycosyltransferase [Acidobacteriota bacterium]
MTLIFACYWLAVFGLFAYGINCYWLTFVFHRHQRQALARLEQKREEFWARTPEDALPTVTIQLPIYNERCVVGRLIHAVSRIDYPESKLEVQVLDDSTDDTSELIAGLVTHFRAQGLDIVQLRRENRDGFKAGALRDGLLTARGELVAIFDADFVPPPDFLRRTVPFFSDERVGLAQCRWGHVNDEFSLLTKTQAMAIDGHFGIEQAARAWGGYFMNFNGTAGVWRRRAIDGAGGWQADTLTEDLDLSYRAQLAGWRIEYLLDVEVPAEIPIDISAFKAQQRRWAKGSIQTAIKLLPRVMRAPLSFGTRIQAALHLTHYLVHPLMLTVALLALPLLAFWSGPWAPLPFAAMVVMLVFATAGPSTLYLSAQRALRTDWKRRALRLPLLMLLGTGIAASNTRAVVEAFSRKKTPFIRTPKHDVASRGAALPRQRYRVPLGALTAAEPLLAAYCGFGLVTYVRAEKYLIGPYLLLYALGFGLVAAAAARELFGDWRRRRLSPLSPEADPVAASATAYERALGTWRPASLFEVHR